LLLPGRRLRLGRVAIPLRPRISSQSLVGDPRQKESDFKADLHQLVGRLPDGAVDGTAILLEEITDGRIDPEQARFWTREWQAKEREADEGRAAGRVTSYKSDDELLVALQADMKPLDADS
jgi:hypothetical protein